MKSPRRDRCQKHLNVRICGAVFAGVFLVGGFWTATDQQLAYADERGAATPSAVVAFDKSEALPGGEATTRRSREHRDAFSRPSANLSFSSESDFRIGNAIFRKVWVSSPSSTPSSDGLGPLYNARSCQRCHLKDGRGHPPAANWPDDNAVSMLFRLSVPEAGKTKAEAALGGVKTQPDLKYGGQLQDHAIQSHAAEGRIHITYKEHQVTFADGETVSLRKPTYRIADPAYGRLNPNLMISPRVAPQMIGLGLLEAIPAQDIISGADPEDENGDGISGRANRAWSLEHNKTMLGRFGWKAGQPTMRQQSAAAFSGDMGLSTTLFDNASGDCTHVQTACRIAPNGNTPEQDNVEVGNELLNLVVHYASNLAVPARDNKDDPIVQTGKEIFHKLGCTACHRPSWTTGKHPEDNQQHLTGQKIWPYTDLLLHDMGEGLADNRPEKEANGREWRTPPLWGIGLTKTVSGHTNFLHDGRARNLTEAILWHGGEAKPARESFVKLTRDERQALLRFLNSL